MGDDEALKEKSSLEQTPQPKETNKAQTSEKYSNSGVTNRLLESIKKYRIVQYVEKIKNLPEKIKAKFNKKGKDNESLAEKLKQGKISIKELERSLEPEEGEEVSKKDKNELISDVLNYKLDTSKIEALDEYRKAQLESKIKRDLLIKAERLKKINGKLDIGLKYYELDDLKELDNYKLAQLIAHQTGELDEELKRKEFGKIEDSKKKDLTIVRIIQNDEGELDKLLKEEYEDFVNPQKNLPENDKKAKKEEKLIRDKIIKQKVEFATDHLLNIREPESTKQLQKDTNQTTIEARENLHLFREVNVLSENLKTSAGKEKDNYQEKINEILEIDEVRERIGKFSDETMRQQLATERIIRRFQESFKTGEGIPSEAEINRIVNELYPFDMAKVIGGINNPDLQEEINRSSAMREMLKSAAKTYRSRIESNIEDLKKNDHGLGDITKALNIREGRNNNIEKSNNLTSKKADMLVSMNGHKILMFDEVEDYIRAVAPQMTVGGKDLNSFEEIKDHLELVLKTGSSFQASITMKDVKNIDTTVIAILRSRESQVPAETKDFIDSYLVNPNAEEHAEAVRLVRDAGFMVPPDIAAVVAANQTLSAEQISYIQKSLKATLSVEKDFIIHEDSHSVSKEIEIARQKALSEFKGDSKYLGFVKSLEKLNNENGEKILNHRDRRAMDELVAVMNTMALQGSGKATENFENPLKLWMLQLTDPENTPGIEKDSVYERDKEVQRTIDIIHYIIKHPDKAKEMTREYYETMLADESNLFIPEEIGPEQLFNMISEIVDMNLVYGGNFDQKVDIQKIQMDLVKLATGGEELSETNPLTEILNRNYAEETLDYSFADLMGNHIENLSDEYKDLVKRGNLSSKDNNIRFDQIDIMRRHIKDNNSVIPARADWSGHSLAPLEGNIFFNWIPLVGNPLHRKIRSELIWNMSNDDYRKKWGWGKGNSKEENAVSKRKFMQEVGIPAYSSMHKVGGGGGILGNFLQALNINQETVGALNRMSLALGMNKRDLLGTYQINPDDLSDRVYDVKKKEYVNYNNVKVRGLRSPFPFLASDIKFARAIPRTLQRQFYRYTPAYWGSSPYKILGRGQLARKIGETLFGISMEHEISWQDPPKRSFHFGYKQEDIDDLVEFDGMKFVPKPGITQTEINQRKLGPDGKPQLTFYPGLENMVTEWDFEKNRPVYKPYQDPNAIMPTMDFHRANMFGTMFAILQLTGINQQELGAMVKMYMPEIGQGQQGIGNFDQTAFTSPLRESDLNYEQRINGNKISIASWTEATKRDLLRGLSDNRTYTPNDISEETIIRGHIHDGEIEQMKKYVNDVLDKGGRPGMGNPRVKRLAEERISNIPLLDSSNNPVLDKDGNQVYKKIRLHEDVVDHVMKAMQYENSLRLLRREYMTFAEKDPAGSANLLDKLTDFQTEIQNIVDDALKSGDKDNNTFGKAAEKVIHDYFNSTPPKTFNFRYDPQNGAGARSINLDEDQFRKLFVRHSVDGEIQGIIHLTKDDPNNSLDPFGLGQLERMAWDCEINKGIRGKFDAHEMYVGGGMRLHKEEVELFLQSLYYIRMEEMMKEGLKPQAIFVPGEGNQYMLIADDNWESPPNMYAIQGNDEWQKTVYKELPARDPKTGAALFWAEDPATGNIIFDAAAGQNKIYNTRGDVTAAGYIPHYAMAEQPTTEIKTYKEYHFEKFVQLLGKASDPAIKDKLQKIFGGLDPTHNPDIEEIFRRLKKPGTAPSTVSMLTGTGALNPDFVNEYLNTGGFDFDQVLKLSNENQYILQEVFNKRATLQAIYINEAGQASPFKSINVKAEMLDTFFRDGILLDEVESTMNRAEKTNRFYMGLVHLMLTANDAIGISKARSLMYKRGSYLHKVPRWVIVGLTGAALLSNFAVPIPLLGWTSLAFLNPGVLPPLWVYGGAIASAYFEGFYLRKKEKYWEGREMGSIAYVDEMRQIVDQLEQQIKQGRVDSAEAQEKYQAILNKYENAYEGIQEVKDEKYHKPKDNFLTRFAPLLLTSFAGMVAAETRR